MRAKRCGLWAAILALTSAAGGGVAISCRSATQDTALPAAYEPRTAAQPGMLFALCEDYPEETRTLERANQDLAFARAQGARAMRVGIGWDGIERSRGTYDFTFWDAYFAAAQRYGVRVIPYLCYTPRWASSKPEADDYWRYPPANLDDWGQFVRVIAKRYRGQATSWELWNEPDNRDYWRGTSEDFASLIRVGAKSVREADPAAKVVLGGIASDPGFTEALFRLFALAPDVDVVNAHAYFETWSPRTIESIPNYLTQLASVVSAYGQHEPVWLAETGYSSSLPPTTQPTTRKVSDWYTATTGFEHTEAYQAEALLRSAALAASTGARLFAWYRVHDLPPKTEVIGDSNNFYLGLLATDGRRKPAANAFRFAATTLAQALPTPELLAESEAQARLFRSPSDPQSLTLITWMPTATERANVSTTLRGAWQCVSVQSATGTRLDNMVIVSTTSNQTRLFYPASPERTLVVQFRRK